MVISVKKLSGDKGRAVSMRTAVLRYRVMAYITGVVLMVLCFVGIPLQIAGHPQVANNVGVVHGILYIIYLGCAWLLARKLRLANGPTVLLLLAGTIPVLTFVVERWMTHRYIDPALREQELAGDGVSSRNTVSP
jgi:integral membrane protein